ncbi:DUF3195 domain-containing protein [Pyrobaculum arsenaticum]|uniref:DUF3195 domain-containing protein n=3 Tax=Pyrobaculum TaxID=2276 RepID=A4WGV4_PYRAR|nr:DUF3195 domain-containing protein [Pyrobaculum arsenaticum]ABP49621.1 conserved hypothetical protein [Pyrobaculum arsenaticum DSM 13514]NYR15608.1 DUF3195 domain-containing protein [Pyrobaculum arsenaticum]
MNRKYIIVRTIPKKEGQVARDLCDCIYFHDSEVMCVPVAVGRVYVYTLVGALQNCLAMDYFKKLVRGFEVYDEVSHYEPSRCDDCIVVKIGEVYFVRRVGKNF